MLHHTGYRYGKSLIPISDADEQAIKFSADRALSVLGFTSMSNVKQHHTLGTSVQLLVSSPGDGVRLTYVYAKPFPTIFSVIST